MIAAGIRTGFGDEWIRLGSHFGNIPSMDRSPNGPWRSARRIRAVVPPYKGNITESQEQLNCVDRTGASGRHSGETAMRMAMSPSICSYRGRTGAKGFSPRATARPKITHCTLINDDSGCGAIKLPE